MCYILPIQPCTLCAFFFSFPTQGAIKITSQTFTASGTSKPPVQHLFYFYSPFSTFPSLLAFSLLRKRKGMEENTQLTKQKRGGRKSILASGFCSEGARSPARSHNPITRGWWQGEEAGGWQLEWGIGDNGQRRWPRGQTGVHGQVREGDPTDSHSV